MEDDQQQKATAEYEHMTAELHAWKASLPPALEPFYHSVHRTSRCPFIADNFVSTFLRASSSWTARLKWLDNPHCKCGTNCSPICLPSWRLGCLGKTSTRTSIQVTSP